MARKPIELEINNEQREELVTMQRSLKLERRYVDRAKVILLSANGETIDSIMKQVSLSRRAVNKWRQRFKQNGLDGLKDAPRSGKKPFITPEQKAMVIQKACSKPEGGYTNWSQSRIAKEVGISQSKVHQILKEADLKPHKIEYWCGKSTDPEFESKMINIIGLYMDPPENAIVLCIDEKTQIQALDRTQPELPLRAGNAKRQTATYKRNGTVSLIAALDIIGASTSQYVETPAIVVVFQVFTVSLAPAQVKSTNESVTEQVQS